MGQSIIIVNVFKVLQNITPFRFLVDSNLFFPAIIYIRNNLALRTTALGRSLFKNLVLRIFLSDIFLQLCSIRIGHIPL